MTDAITILDVPFISTTMSNLIDVLDERLEAKRKTFLVTANPEILMYAKKNPSYQNTLKRADYVIPDGIGVVIGSKLLGKPIQERLAGYDLVQELLKLSSKKGYKLYFLGAHPDVIGEAVHQVELKFPAINIVGYHHGYFDIVDEEIIKDIKIKAPDILLVGLGFPKQEQWIERYQSELQKGLMIGVGGTFDGLAGKLKRAPEIWIKLNIEWLHRLLKQPSRWRRMLAIPHFMGIIFKQRFLNK